MRNIGKLQEMILFGGLLLLPHVYSPTSDIKYEIPKVLFFFILTAILIILYLLSFSKLKHKVNVHLLKIILIYYCCVALSIAFGVNIPKSIGGNYYRLDGFITLTMLILFSLVISCIWKERLIRTFTTTITISTALINLLLLFEYVSDLVFYNFQFRYLIPSGYNFGNENFLTGYLLIILPFLTYEIRLTTHKLKKRILLANFIVTLLTITATQSRVGFFLIPLFGIFYFLTLKTRRVLLSISVIAFVISISVVCFTTFKSSQFVAEGRERIIIKGLLAYKNAPILGYGYANFDYAFASADWPIKFNDDVNVDKAHGIVLEHLVTTGIVGLCAYVWLTLTILNTLIQRIKTRKNNYWNKTLFISFLMFLIHSQTNVISINEELYYWFILGITIQKL